MAMAWGASGSARISRVMELNKVAKPITLIVRLDAGRRVGDNFGMARPHGEQLACVLRWWFWPQGRLSRCSGLAMSTAD